MKNAFLKYAPLFIALTALADTQFDLLLQIGLTETSIAWVKLLGLLTALFLPSVKDTFVRRDVGGATGGLVKPKPKRP